MLEKEEPKLQRFFNELIAGTNPQKKNSVINQQNKKKLVMMCYFLAGLNNKLINSVKIEVGFLLDTSETSALIVETLANTRLIIRKKIIQKQKYQLAKSHQQTVKDYIIKNVIFFFLLILFY